MGKEAVVDAREQDEDQAHLSGAPARQPWAKPTMTVIPLSETAATAGTAATDGTFS